MNKDVFRSNLFQLDFFNRHSFCITLLGASNADRLKAWNFYEVSISVINYLLTVPVVVLLLFFTKEIIACQCWQNRSKYLSLLHAISSKTI